MALKINPAWLAGFIDGEGTVGVYRLGHAAAPQVRVQIPQKKKDVLELIEDSYPGGFYLRHPKTTVWTYVLQGRKTRTILEDIAPFVFVKRFAVGKTLAFLDLLESIHPIASRGNRYTPQQRELLNRYVAETKVKKCA